MPVTVAPSPAALVRTDASNRARAAPVTCSLTSTAMRDRPERPQPDHRAAAGGDRLPAREHRLGHEVGPDLDAGHEVARADHLAVEHREHLERVDPVEALEGAQADGDDAGDRRHEVDP